MSKDLNALESMEKKRGLFLALSLIVLILLALYFTSIGVSDSSFLEVFLSIRDWILGRTLTSEQKIIVNLRLPRTSLAILAGAGLSLAGLIMQAITANPLVSPFTTGVSSAAGFGAALAIVFGFGFLGSGNLAVVSNAFIFALMASSFILILSRRMDFNSSSIVLSGIAINYLFQALSTSVQFVAEDTKLASVVNWSFGSLNSAKWIECVIVLIILVLSSSLIFIKSRDYSIMAINSEDVAISMGVDTKKMRIMSNILSALMAASIISFTGVIGFVGLAGPHIARSILGNNYKYLIPGAMSVGSLLLLVSDTIGRTIISPLVLPVGIVVSFIGVPIFLYQVFKMRRP